MTNGEKYKTTNDRVYAFRKHCRDKGTCHGCALNETGVSRTICVDRCILDWLTLEAEEELLACPFCGSKDIKVIQATVSGYVATCDECWAASCAAINKIDAIAAWNRRAK